MSASCCRLGVAFGVRPIRDFACPTMEESLFLAEVGDESDECTTDPLDGAEVMGDILPCTAEAVF